MAYPHALRALASRNFRLFSIGQGVSLIGNWMTVTASGWLVYQLSGSAFYVGAVGFFTQIPLLLAPFTGVWVDRIDRHRAFLWLQVAAALQSGTLAIVTLSGHISVPLLLLLCLWQGLINAIEFPVRQSLLIAFVDRREDLPSAIALGSSLYNVARLVGPAIAGFIIAQWGTGVCYGIDSLSYLPVIGLLLLMRIPRMPPRTRSTRPLEDLREGLAYVRDHAPLRRALILVPIVTSAGWAHTVLAPVFAQDIFRGDARLLGFMLAIVGAGALLGAFRLGSRASSDGLDRTIFSGVLLMAAAQALFAVSTSLPLSFAALIAGGYGSVHAMAGNNTWIQSMVDDDKRGRVMGLFVMGQGMFPIGSLLVGLFAQFAGARLAVAVASAICLIAALNFRRMGGATKDAPLRMPDPGSR